MNMPAIQTGPCVRLNARTAPLHPRTSHADFGGSCAPLVTRSSVAAKEVAAAISSPLGFKVALRNTAIGVNATVIPTRLRSRASLLQAESIAAPSSARDKVALAIRIRRERLSGLASSREIAAGSRYGNG